jgi:predicted Rossmann fold flavoprotein
MMAAIRAARCGAEVTVLESGKKAGAKLLVTGNSRCNLTNLAITADTVYGSYLKDEAAILVRSVLSALSVSDTLEFFRSMGLFTSAEHETYIYPVTGQSQSVLACMMREMDRLRVKRKFGEDVRSIKRSADGRWEVRTQGWTYSCDRVILSCGSAAGGLRGIGDGTALVKDLGLKMTKILPALSAIRCRENVSACAGARMQAFVRAFSGGRELASESGQLQWTQYGISGIVVFNIARHITRPLSEGEKIDIELDLLPMFDEDDLVRELEEMRAKDPGLTVKELLAGLLPDRVIPLFTTGPDTGIRELVRRIRHLRLEAVSLRPIAESQAAAGGVSLDEIDPVTLECRRSALKGIYVTGELLDIDGPCGGYNLHFAFASGIIAGESI